MNKNQSLPLKDVLTICRELAHKIRLHSVNMTHRARSSHVGSSLSMAEILAVLYGKILRISPKHVDDPLRDRLIMSKGHACAGLYAVLAETGYFPVEWLESFYGNGAKLAGHVTRGAPGIEVSTGSLGHGLPIGCGMAMAAQRDNKDYRIFCVLSDGECDEGSNWEAALFAGHHRLDNLTVIIDYNKIQSLGHVRDVLDLEPFAAKWQAFRWAVREVDGHNIESLITNLTDIPYEPGKPSCLIAHTVKGKGVSFMEDKLLWHYRTPQGEEYEAALKELESPL
jgi:transketolase